jgi:DNA-binding NtrC family response regulator
VLVVDDEPSQRRSLARLLMAGGFDVLTAEDGRAGLSLLATTRIDVVLLDADMPGMSGLEALRRIKEAHPAVEVVVMAAWAEMDAAATALRAGAYDVLTKPFDFQEAVTMKLAQAAEHKRLVERTHLLEQRLSQHEKLGELVGSSPRMKEVYRLALGVAPTASTVLLHGENGTGKELVARAIHQHSLRSDRPLCIVNCGTLAENLIETELFGSVAHAGNGAIDRAGVLELADKGTVLLDEIAALPLSAQTKLLHTLAHGEVRREGAPEPRVIDVRILAATNVDLKQRIAAGRFREDLYYRLDVIPIHLPPLRQRRDDIPLLAYHFLQKYSRRAGRDIRRIGVEALRLLRDHGWPGNVRELENAIEHAVVIARGESIMPSDLPFSRDRDAVQGAACGGTALRFGEDLSELAYAEAKNRAVNAFDRSYLEQLMRRVDGNISEAARQAAMDRSNFRRLLKKAKLPAGSAAEEDEEDAGD